MNKRFFIILVSLMLATAAFANGNIAGTVFLGPPPAGPAAGATVILHRNMQPGDSLTAITNAEGHFGFTNIASGGWQAVAIFEGHLPGFGFVNVPFNGGTANLVLVLGPSLDDLGAVAGTVLTAEGAAAVGAHVRLAQMQDPAHPHGFVVETETDAAGAFGFGAVPPGIYNINAGLMGEGFASAVIEVVIDQTTNVVLTLGGGNGGGDHPHDSLTVVELTGVAIVLPPDGDHLQPLFFLDVNADGQADYRLAFGPPWYDPNGPAEPNRPVNGAEISVVGGLLTYGEPPMVVVFQLNGMFWRDPRNHGGHGGGHHGLGCEPDSITAIDLAGTAIVHTIDNPFGEINRYAIDTDADGEVNYALMFGPPDYDPNGAEAPNRPLNGDVITIVGGLMECDNMPFGAVIVYEINGMIWREPGDTTGFATYNVELLGADDPIEVPVTHIMASNYPNPFNPATMIAYALPTSGMVSLKVFDIVGREVATLVNANQAAGAYSVSWNGSDMPSGIYMYRLSVAGQSVTGKMVLMK